MSSNQEKIAAVATCKANMDRLVAQMNEAYDAVRAAHDDLQIERLLNKAGDLEERANLAEEAYLLALTK